MTIGPLLRHFGWTYLRALLWVAAVAFALRSSTGNRRVWRAFISAHAVALGVGVLTDLFMVCLAPRAWLRIEVTQWIFTAPIAIFTVISLWIGDREVPVKVPDVFMTLAPVVAWALLVIHGWQDMYDCHVLGAWFVSAACGGVDLFTRAGPAWALRRSWPTRAAGYAVIVLLVYLGLPWTQ